MVSVLRLEGALRVPKAYCTKQSLVQCGRKRGGVEGGGSLHKSRLRFSVVAQYVAGCHLDHIAQNGRGVMQQIQPLLASFGNRPVGFNSFNPSFRRACCARQITSNAYPGLQQLLRRPKWQLGAQSVDFC